MAESTFLLLEADQFDATLENVATETELMTFNEASGAAVRRPYRGIQIDEDTYATLQMWRADGIQLRKFRDAGSAHDDGLSYFYTNFVVQEVTESREEKFQLLETFGDPFGFFFGERPRMLRVTGILVDSLDFNWRAEWWANYDTNLRGTKLVEQGARVYFTVNTTIVEGYLINSQTTQRATDQHTVPFSFTMWVTGYRDISHIGITEFQYPSISTESEAWDWNSAHETFGSESATPTGMYVRQLNIQSQTQTLDSLTDILSAGLDAISSALNFVETGLDYFKNVVMGKNVRVPAGFEGSDLLTQGNELASGTLPAGTTTVSGLKGLMTAQTTAQIPEFDWTDWWTTHGLKPGTYYENWDEYAKGGAGATTLASMSAYEDKTFVEIMKAGEEAQAILDLETKSREAFAEFGVDPDFYLNEDFLLMSSAVYSASMYAAATGFEQQRKSEADYIASEEADRNAYYSQSEGEFNPDPEA